MAGPCSPCSCLQKALLPLVALTFTTWVVSLGGVGSMQYLCTEPYQNSGYLSGVRGFSAARLPCDRLLSYYWWIVALEFIVLCALALVIMAGHLEYTRLAWAGLLAVATTLYIQSADSFLAATSVPHYEEGLEMHTARATAAGFIMTAVFNFVLIVVVGCDTKPASCPYDKGQQQQGADAA